MNKKSRKSKLIKIVSATAVSAVGIIPAVTLAATNQNNQEKNNINQNTRLMSDTKTRTVPSFARNFQLDSTFSFKGVNNQFVNNAASAGIPLSSSNPVLNNLNPGLWLDDKFLYVNSETTVGIYDINNPTANPATVNLDLGGYKIADVSARNNVFSVLIYKLEGNNFKFQIKTISKEGQLINDASISGTVVKPANNVFGMRMSYASDKLITVSSSDPQNSEDIYFASLGADFTVNQITPLKITNHTANINITSPASVHLDNSNKNLLFYPYIKNDNPANPEITLRLALGDTWTNEVTIANNNQITKFVNIDSATSRNAMVSLSGNKVNFLSFLGIVKKDNTWQAAFIHQTIGDLTTFEQNPNQYFTNNQNTVNTVFVPLNLTQEQHAKETFDFNASISFNDKKLIMTFSPKADASAKVQILSIDFNNNLEYNSGIGTIQVSQDSGFSVPNEIRGNYFYPMVDKSNNQANSNKVIIDKRKPESGGNSQAWVIEKGANKWQYDYETELKNANQAFYLVIKDLEGSNDLAALASKIEIYENDQLTTLLKPENILYNPIKDSKFNFENIQWVGNELKADVYLSTAVNANGTLNPQKSFGQQTIHFKLADIQPTDKFGYEFSYQNDDFQTVFPAQTFNAAFNYEQVWDIASEKTKIDEAVKTYLTAHLDDYINIPANSPLQIIGIKDGSITLTKQQNQVWSVSLDVETKFKDTTNIIKTQHFDNIIKFKLNNLDPTTLLTANASVDVDYNNPLFATIFTQDKVADYKYIKVWDDNTIKANILAKIDQYLKSDTNSTPNLNTYVTPIEGITAIVENVEIVNGNGDNKKSINVSVKWVLGDKQSQIIVKQHKYTNFLNFVLEVVSVPNPTPQQANQTIKATSSDFSKYFSDDLKNADNWQVSEHDFNIKPEIKTNLKAKLSEHISDFLTIPQGLSFKIKDNFVLQRAGTSKDNARFYLIQVKNVQVEIFKQIDNQRVVFETKKIPNLINFRLSPSFNQFQIDVQNFIGEYKAEDPTSKPIDWLKKSIVRVLSKDEYKLLFKNNADINQQTLNINIPENSFNYKNPFMKASGVTIGYEQATSSALDLNIKYTSATKFKKSKIIVTADEFKNLMNPKPATRAMAEGQQTGQQNNQNNVQSEPVSWFTQDWLNLYTSIDKAKIIQNKFINQYSGDKISELIDYPLYDEHGQLLTKIVPFLNQEGKLDPSGSKITGLNSGTNKFFITLKLKGFVASDLGTQQDKTEPSYFEINLNKAPSEKELIDKLGGILKEKYKTGTTWESNEAIEYILNILNSYTPNAIKNGLTEEQLKELNPEGFTIPFEWIPDKGLGKFSLDNLSIKLKTNEFKYWMDIDIKLKTPPGQQVNSTYKFPSMNFHLDLTAKQLGIDVSGWWKIAMYIIGGLIGLILIIVIISSISKSLANKKAANIALQEQTALDPLDEEL